MCKNSFFEGKADLRLNGNKDSEINVIIYSESAQVKEGGTFLQVENTLTGELMEIRLCQLNGLSKEEKKIIEKNKKEKNKKRKIQKNKKETYFRR